MTALLPAALLSLELDGAAAHRHASALAALGPHPWGSPRARAAAEYVAAQFREAGLGEVRLQEFESHGIRGANVIGVLRAPGPEFLVVGAHHDSAPGSPGAYDDGGGVGVLIEAARVLARRSSRPRALVFASWDGEEAWSTGRTTTAGARAFIQELGPRTRDVVAALVVEMCGWPGGAPVFHAIAYDDPLRPGGSVITPAWLIRAAQEGARAAGAPFPVGDPRLSWLYQPTVRAFRAPRHYGDDLAFLQAGLPAVFVSDSSFSSYYPWYHQSSDTPDKIAAASLARVGQGVLGAVEALGRVPRGPAAEPAWFAASGSVVGGTTLLAVGVASVLPGLAVAAVRGGAGRRLLQAALFGLLLWRQPVPALWVFLVPNVLTLARRRWLTLLSLAPALALAAMGAVAWARGFVTGPRLTSWEGVAGIIALALLLADGMTRRKAGRKAGSRRR
jgi:hypothetical protein